MFKIINENVEELEALAAKPTVEKVKLSEIKKEQKNEAMGEELKGVFDALESYLDLPASDQLKVITGLFDDNDENK